VDGDGRRVKHDGTPRQLGGIIDRTRRGPTDKPGKTFGRPAAGGYIMGLLRDDYSFSAAGANVCLCLTRPPHYNIAHRIIAASAEPAPKMLLRSSLAF